MRISRRGVKHKPEHGVVGLRDAGAILWAGKDLEALQLTLSVSEATLARRLARSGGMKTEEGRWLKAIENGGRRLQELVEHVSLDHEMLRSYGGGVVSPSRKRAAVSECQAKFGISERRLCITLD